MPISVAEAEEEDKQKRADTARFLNDAVIANHPQDGVAIPTFLWLFPYIGEIPPKGISFGHHASVFTGSE